MLPKRQRPRRPGQRRRRVERGWRPRWPTCLRAAKRSTARVRACLRKAPNWMSPSTACPPSATPPAPRSRSRSRRAGVAATATPRSMTRAPPTRRCSACRPAAPSTASPRAAARCPVLGPRPVGAVGPGTGVWRPAGVRGNGAFFPAPGTPVGVVGPGAPQQPRHRPPARHRCRGPRPRHCGRRPGAAVGRGARGGGVGGVRAAGCDPRPPSPRRRPAGGRHPARARRHPAPGPPPRCMLKALAAEARRRPRCPSWFVFPATKSPPAPRSWATCPRA